MKASQTTFDTIDTCPHCDKSTFVIKLGSEPAREVCGRLSCDWEGITLREETPVQEETGSGVIIE